MNTTNTVPVNIHDLTIMQLLRFVSSSDMDASEFGTRYVLYLSLLAKNNRSLDERDYMMTLWRALVDSYSNEAFRQHLSEVLRGREVR